MRPVLLRLAGWLGALLLAQACEFPAPEARPGPMTCNGDVDCTTSGASVCDLSADPAVCVQCTPGPSGNAGACTGTTPVCDAAKTCRGCTADSECASGVCTSNGSCAAASDIAYVSGTVDANTACNEAAPCSKLVTALATSKPFIRVTGTTMHDMDTVIDGKTVTIVGGVNAKVDRTGGGSFGNVIRVTGAANVVLRGLEVSGGDGDGVEVADGTVTITSSKLQNNKVLGLNVTGGAVTVMGTVISGNEAGGILVADDQKLVITNSFIVKNTNNSGLRIGKPGAGSKIEFNTIVDNTDGNGSADAGGVFCDDSTFTARYNLIFRNVGGPNPGTVQTFGSCKFENSFILPGTGAGDDRLKFKSANDYHLTAMSPAEVRDVAGVVCTGLTDYDGDARPQGTACDLGADEHK